MYGIVYVKIAVLFVICWFIVAYKRERNSRGIKEVRELQYYL